jgi:Co/Zn/Cd efflux system component
MSAKCCHETSNHRPQSRGDRNVLLIVLGINAAMFLVETLAGLSGDSVSLQADALDSLADSANYGISLFVVDMATRSRAKAALAKGVTMAALGAWVLAASTWHAISGTLPRATTMGAVGIVALLANAACVALLWSRRCADSNMRSVWLCSRNDVIGNAAVLLAALGVFGTKTGWPDFTVAAVMGGLALQGARQVVRMAIGELHDSPAGLRGATD